MNSPVADETPRANRDLHRRTLLKNTVGATPLRRGTPAASAPEGSNDESERTNRRSLVDIQRRLSSIPTNSPLSDFSKNLGENDVKHHIQICTKLYIENKINAKNAWKLHIIDVLKHMARESRTDILQVASSALDISAKVYGIRVDDIHADGMKLASNMARVSDKAPAQHQDGDAGETAEKEAPATRTKKRRKPLLPGEKHTIAKDPQQLRNPLPKLESALFSTRTKAESNAIENLLTNTLRMDNSGYKFTYLTGEVVWPHKPDPVVKDINESECKYPYLINELKDITICAPFSNFEIDDWNPEEEEKQLAEKKSSILNGQELVFDDDGIPIHELDGSVCNIFADDPQIDDMNEEEEVVHEEIAHQLRGEVANIVEFRPEHLDGTKRSEYSYNTVINTCSGKVIDQIWAGPSHWKLKYLKRSSAKFSGQVSTEVKQRQGKRRAQPQAVDFDEVTVFDLNRRIRTAKRPSTIDNYRITLPIPDGSCQKMIEHRKELLSKPGVYTVQPATDNGIDYEVSTYKYDNPNDSEYCSQPNTDDNPDDGDELFDQHREMEEIMPQEEFMGDNLVEAPEAIPRSFVPYALQAKRMDMKKLKTAVWHTLTQSMEDIPTNNQQRGGKVIPTDFSKLYKELPDRLNEKMRQELTCPLAFVALLHLCNEQNLQLNQYPGYKDFKILGPKV